MHDRWERVVQKEARRRPGERIYVSLNRRGEIAMNDAAWGAIGRPYNVALLYDAERRRIGIKYPVTADRHFFPVRRYGREGRTLVVRAARLLKQFGMELAETLRFRRVEFKRLGKEPMLVLALDGAEALNPRRNSRPADRDKEKAS
jgi:hypothetical protein